MVNKEQEKQEKSLKNVNLQLQNKCTLLAYHMSSFLLINFSLLTIMSLTSEDSLFILSLIRFMSSFNVLHRLYKWPSTSIPIIRYILIFLVEGLSRRHTKIESRKKLILIIEGGETCVLSLRQLQSQFSRVNSTLRCQIKRSKHYILHLNTLNAHSNSRRPP
jgi:hypothetical protein